MKAIVSAALAICVACGATTGPKPPATGTNEALPSFPVTLPADCRVLSASNAAGRTEWKLDCGPDGNANARSKLGQPLAREGWRECGAATATAYWAKGSVMVTISEGSGTPGEGFRLVLGPVGSPCA